MDSDGVQDSVGVMARFYAAVADGDVAGILGALSPEVEWHAVRPASDDVVTGRSAWADYAAEAVGVHPEDGNVQVQAVAADGAIGFSLHIEAAGTPREHRHVLVWEIDGDHAERVWELTLGAPTNRFGRGFTSRPGFSQQ